MKFGLQRKHGSLNSVFVFDAVAEGLTKLGHTVVDDTVDCDVPCCGVCCGMAECKATNTFMSLLLHKKRKFIFRSWWNKTQRDMEGRFEWHQ